MKHTIIGLLFVSLFFTSCTEKPVEESGLPEILLKKSKDILPISSFIKKLDYLELKVHEAGMELGDITYIKELNGDLIVLQRRAREISFIRFSKKGDFLNTVVSNKEGTGKIKVPLDIISYKNDFAVLADDGIYIVGKDGEYKSRLIATEMPGTKFFESNNRFFVVNDVPDYGLYTVYTSNGEVKNMSFPEARLKDLGRSNLAMSGAANIVMVSSYSDTVFAYQKTAFKPEYLIESDGYPSFAETWRNKETKDDMETLKYMHNNQHSKIKSYFENKNYIFLTYWLGSYQTTALIKKRGWETTYFTEAVNNIDGGIWDNPTFLSPNNELYIPITAYKVGGHKISDKRHKEFEKVQLHIAATGNPVLMRCQLK
ncbi:6-bladed beta-propeller [Draconibacterium sp. IB214405]|uniref:6-bladed beta-propeller n=1 Tax=Draconibacterium sp. IB214405 TaxID=3097352 RepID=UPI002A0AF187|nr:6-bladed beta-propeller [Draconibacterium sp. IB214405]MDX8340176.1 6-bladed beta-propeller [Draconibacterium sp. IB214405]